MSPIATTDAPTTPVAAASIAPTKTTASANPPRNVPKSLPMVVRRSSARRDFSSTTPMKMKKGIATRTRLDITPKMRWGRAYISPQSKSPMAMPMKAKIREVPPRAKATG